MTRVFYSADLDANDWAVRCAAGEVPDRWPYGLDHLPEAVAEPGRDDTGWGLRERALRKVDGRFDWRVRAAPGTASVCWDERVGVPVALSRHDAPVVSGVIWLTDQPGPSRLARRALDRCDAVWVLSSAQLEPLQRRWRQPESRLHHVLMGVDELFWHPEAAAPEPGTLLVVGNDRDRDHPTAIGGALRARRDAFPELSLTLVSHHAVEVPDELGRRVGRLDHVALAEKYRRSAVVAVATRPNLHCSGITTVLEAMASARPVVVTATPGMADYVDDGVTGLLVPPGDAAALAAALSALLDDPAAAERMGRAGRAAVERRFTSRLQAARIAALLEP